MVLVIDIDRNDAWMRMGILNNQDTRDCLWHHNILSRVYSSALAFGFLILDSGFIREMVMLCCNIEAEGGDEGCDWMVVDISFAMHRIYYLCYEMR